MSRIERRGNATEGHLYARSILKEYYAEAERRRVQRLGPLAPKGAEAPSEMRMRVANVVRSGAAMVAFCKERQVASIAWAEPSRHWRGAGAIGIVVLREELHLRKGETTGAYPVAAISHHAMGRMTERSGVDSLDGVMKQARTALGWAHVAREVGFDGEFLVPHRDGLLCCRATMDGIICEWEAPEARPRPITVIKTWIGNADLNVSFRATRKDLLKCLDGLALPFPGFEDMNDDLQAKAHLLRDAGRGREEIRANGFGGPQDHRFVT